MKKSIACYALFTLLLSLFCWPLFAYQKTLTLPWLAAMHIDDARHWQSVPLNEMKGLFDCGEEANTQYCSAPVKYYKTEVESNVWVKNGLVDSVDVYAAFSALSYSELQVNLRKDGFMLAWIQIGDESIDVIDALKHKPLYKVDRDVVMFMNKGAISTARKLIWYPKTEYYDALQTRYVEFLSDGKQISMRFIRGSYRATDDL